MAEKVIELLNRYGDREFGEEWWPLDARAWMEPDKAKALSEALRVPGSDIPETAALITEYGETKFGTKWRPWEAENVLEQAEAEALAGFLSDLGLMSDYAPTAGPAV